MISKFKIALVAAAAAVGIATPALADGFPIIPKYQTVAHGRALYGSATAPNRNGRSYVNESENWASDAEWSTTGRQNIGR